MSLLTRNLRARGRHENFQPAPLSLLRSDVYSDLLHDAFLWNNGADWTAIHTGHRNTLSALQRQPDRYQRKHRPTYWRELDLGHWNHSLRHFKRASPPP